MKQNYFEKILPLPIHKLKEEAEIQLAKSPLISKNELRVVACLTGELVEKLKDYVYWERTTQKEVLVQALEEFIKNKNIKSRPEAVKIRKKPGRKRKN